MENLRNIVKGIKLLVLDVDGVLTDNSLFYTEEGEYIKKFHVRDGQGIKLAQAYNLEIAIVSGRVSKIVENRCKELGVKFIYQYCYDKVKVVKELLVKLNLTLEEIAYIGDDILDVPPMEIVGLPVCPKDSHPTAKNKAKIVTESCGGNGCVREVIDLILKEQGKVAI